MGICPSVAKALNLEASDVSVSWCLEMHASTHANASLPFDRPWHYFRWYFNVPFVEWNPRIRLMKMNVGRNDSMLKDVYRFDNTSQTRGGFEMANL